MDEPVTSAASADGDLDGRCRLTVDGDVDVQQSGDAIRCEAGHEGDVGERHVRHRHQLDAAVQPREPPLVLVLEPRRRAPPRDGDGHVVGTGSKRIGDVVRRCQLAVGADADEAAIDPHDAHRVGGADAEVGATAAPPGGKAERSPVDRCRVVAGYVRRLPVERHADVEVDRRAVTAPGFLEYPRAGHLDVRPPVALGAHGVVVDVVGAGEQAHAATSRRASGPTATALHARRRRRRRRAPAPAPSGGGRPRSVTATTSATAASPPPVSPSACRCGRQGAQLGDGVLEAVRVPEQGAAGDEHVGARRAAPPTVAGVMPPSTSTSTSSSSPAPAIIRRTSAIFGSIVGMYAWPPNPELTVITRTRSTRSSTWATALAGVAGSMATPAAAPSSPITPSVRWRCGARLDVDDQPPAARLDVARGHHLGGQHHQVGLERDGDEVARRGDDVGTERQVGDELAVHHVPLDEVDAGLLQGDDLLTEAGEVGRQHRRGDLDRAGHRQ